MKRGCWIAIWAIAAYAAAIVGVNLGTQLTHNLLAGVTMPVWLTYHLGLMSELAHGLLPYIATSVILALGIGAHLPGTRRPQRAPTAHSWSLKP